ncbi:UNVERIFIED_CONTAM: Paladin [Sesamum angustifolium]|uniref:Paladin n=1 Tax=Sesamum angustifolium TaxID=2727405 RepID=A0AAW2IQ31_9LAMI
MEDRLKEDVLMEAARYGNKILVTDELPDGQMVDQWEPVSHDSVKTPLQVHKISQANVRTEIVFNCQMGRGRTTTGMVIATLIYINRIGASGIPRTNSMGKVSDCCSTITPDLPNTEESIRRGEYAVIRSLIRVLEGGVEGKRQVDKVIDKCASMQNLREAIACYRSSILCQADEMKREASLSFFVEYLERYYFLICFAVYLHTEREALHPISPGKCSFTEWMRARPELYSILRRLLRRDPMGALGYANLKPSLAKSAVSSDGRPLEMSQVAALRNGEVLGSQTVLKSDHCPGCQHPSLPERLEGAPNFREIPGFPVYGVANPTIDGIRSVIQRIGSSKGGRPVFWHNMREEPVVYINGKPFVLREVERPYKNMLEYTGIDCERVERMEARLKDDILREAERYQGAIMVIHETDDGQISDAWEHVSLPAVQTPREVFRCFEENGFPIKYARVPITDGKAPKGSDFDTLAMNIISASKDTAFVFNCQVEHMEARLKEDIISEIRQSGGRMLLHREEYNPALKQASVVGSAGSYLFVSHTGFGGVAYAMAIICIKLEAEAALTSRVSRSIGSPCSSNSQEEFSNSDEEARKMGDYRDILSLIRVLVQGPESKADVDSVIDKCAGAGHLRDDILYYSKELEKLSNDSDEHRACLVDMGIKALRRYFFLIAFRSYLYSTSANEMKFTAWMDARPELGHLCNNLRVDR